MTTNTNKQSQLRGLKPWAKGQSGNPKGRPPKEKCLVTMIEQYLTFTPEQLKLEAVKPNLDIAHRLAVKYILDCHEHPNHTDRLMDRLYGAPRQSTEITGADGGPVENRIIVASEDDKKNLERVINGERT